MIPLSLDSLHDFLTKNELDVKRQPETEQLYILFKAHEQEYPLFIRILESGDLLQLLAFMPITLEPKIMPDLARALHLFNKEIDLPGFCMDEVNKISFYRVMLTAVDKKISGEHVRGFINAIQVITNTFFPVIAAVASGSATFEDIIKKPNETIKP